MAGVLSLGPRAVAASETAARLHGFLNGVDTPVRALLSKGQHRRTRPGIAVHEAILERTDIRTVSGIRVTAPNRTLVDLAGVRSERGLEAALDDAILLGLTTVASLKRYIAHRRLEHRPGAKTVRKLLDERTPGVPQKELERLFLRKLRASRLPDPVRQHPVGKRRIDFAYPEAKIAIELDGLRDHFSAAAFQNDRRRQNEIVLAGLVPLRFTWDDVNGHWPRVEGTLRRALGLPESG